jgi:hypothetical protein
LIYLERHSVGSRVHRGSRQGIDGGEDDRVFTANHGSEWTDLDDPSGSFGGLDGCLHVWARLAIDERLDCELGVHCHRTETTASLVELT